MEVDFRNKNLVKLYEKGSNSKYRFVDKNLYRKFVEKVNRLIAAKDINDLRNPPSNRFEKLAGFDNKFSLGKITEESLLEIWNKEKFKDFRKKVKEFPFSDCTQCSGCEMSKENTEDCHGNEFPVCGDCLWARGVIQCP